MIVALERLGPGRDVLDFGLGTGRIAIPLAAAAFDVAGIEASPAMVETFRAKTGADGIDAVIGDFTATSLKLTVRLRPDRVQHALPPARPRGTLMRP